MHRHCWIGTQVTSRPPHYSILAQQPTLALKPPPALAVYLDPRPQSWFHGQEGWVVAEPVCGRRQGNYGVNKKTFPPPCLGQEAQSHGGGGQSLPPCRPQGCGGGPRAPWAANTLWAGPAAHGVGVTLPWVPSLLLGNQVTVIKVAHISQPGLRP